MKKRTIINITIYVLTAAMLVGTFFLMLPYFRYNMASIHINKGENKEAYDILLSLDYKDSKEKLQNFFVEYKEIELVYYSGNDTTPSDTMKYQKEFDKEGKILLEKSIATVNGAQETSEVKYFYDERGLLGSVEQYTNGALEGYTLYKYDANGNQTLAQWCDKDGALLYFTESEYNDKDILIKETFGWSKNDQLTSNYEYEYYEDGKIKARTRVGESEFAETLFDEAGNVTEEAVYDIGGTLISRYKYTYDKNGNKIKSEQFGEKNELGAYTENEYDSEGNIILKKDYVEGSLNGKTEYKYQNPVYCYKAK